MTLKITKGFYQFSSTFLNLSRSEKQSQLWIESKRQSSTKCQSNFTNQSNVGDKARKNKCRFHYLFTN